MTISNFYKVEQLTEQSTTSATFVDVPSSTLTFTPNETSEIWMIFVTGVCRSSSTSEQSFEMRLLINGAEEDLWSHQNLSANSPNGAGFLIFDRITGTTALQTIKVQYRVLDASTCYTNQLRIVVARLPANADFQYFESNGIVSSSGSNLPIGTLQFTPPFTGNYFIIGSLKHREYPGGSTSQAWFEGADGVLHPNANTGVHHSNARDCWNPSTYIWRENLAAVSKTFNIRFTSSASGAEASEHRYRKLMAFREDVWDISNYNLSAGESTSTSTVFQTKNTLTTAVPPESQDYLSIQASRISATDASGNARKSGELRIGGSALMRTDHRISRDGSAVQGYHHTIGLVDVRNTGSAVTYANGYLSPDATTLQCAESAIVVLRYVTGKQTHQMML